MSEIRLINGKTNFEIHEERGTIHTLSVEALVAIYKEHREYHRAKTFPYSIEEAEAFAWLQMYDVVALIDMRCYEPEKFDRMKESYLKLAAHISL